MKNLRFRPVFFLLCTLILGYVAQARPAPFLHASPIDSVGIEKKDGKRYILHRVDEGQTLFALARRYGRSVAEIKAANPDMHDAVRYDQLVRIPIPDGALSRKEEKSIDKAIRKKEKEEKQTTKVEESDDKNTDTKAVAKAEKNTDKIAKKADDPARAGIHVVEPGQTLYSLASRYGVSQADLRRWNNLSGNNVLIGQALIVSEKAHQSHTPSSPMPTTKPAESTTRPTTTHPAESHSNEPQASEPKASEPRVSEPRSVPSTEPKPERRNESVAITRPTSTETKPVETKVESKSATDNKPTEVEIELPRPGNDAPMPTRGRRISTSGVAEMIEGADDSGKYLALHRTAPIGTLVQVRNEFNNQSLWVKVVGRLPNTGMNDKILIKLSTQAFTKLSPSDHRFRAEVSYIAR